MSARAGDGWRLAGSLCALEDEVNARWPGRDHASDGSIGDTVHSAEGRPSYNAQGYGTSGSDHEPDNLGVVCALDIDSGPGIDIQALVDAITAEPDPRIAYVIWNRRIFSNREGTAAWAWRDYAGLDPHTSHTHVSTRHGAIADNTTPWAINGEPHPQPTPEAPDMGFVIIRARTTHRIAATNFINTRMLGGKQSAAAGDAQRSVLGHAPPVTDVDEDVFDALLAGNAQV